jgi:nitroreductase
MMDILELIEQRQSSRVPFDPTQRIPEDHLRQILEGARWAPTAHNMQNFEIVVVDDRQILDELANIPTETSRVFVEENYDQLSSSEEELRRRKVGLLGTMFPPSWRVHGVAPDLEEVHAHSILGAPIYFKMSAAFLIVLYDSRKRAPASEGDVLGMISLGCVMENMWLVAAALGIGFHVQSVMGADRVAQEVQRVLRVPEFLKIGFAVRLGYPATPATYLRVRRDVEDFTHRNRFGRKHVGGTT